MELCSLSLACLIPTCHHCGVSGHIRLNCFQIRSQKPWNKTHAPRKDEPGFEEQVKKLSDQVKLISEKLAYLTPNEQRSVLVNNNKKASKQVRVKKEDNLCLVAHIALKILETCLWYLDSGCSKHMKGDKTLLKEVQIGANPKLLEKESLTFQVSKHLRKLCMWRGSRQISSASANFVTMIWWCDSPKRTVIFFTVVASGLWGEKELLTTAMVFLVSLQTLKFSAIRQP